MTPWSLPPPPGMLLEAGNLCCLADFWLDFGLKFCISEISPIVNYTGWSKKTTATLNFPLPATHQLRAADAQPISPDGTCVTELSRNFFTQPCS